MNTLLIALFIISASAFFILSYFYLRQNTALKLLNLQDLTQKETLSSQEIKITALTQDLKTSIQNENEAHTLKVASERELKQRQEDYEKAQHNVNELQIQVQTLKSELARADERQSASQKMIADMKQFLDHSQKQVEDQFKSTASDIIKSQTEQFLTQAKGLLETVKEVHSSQIQTQQHTLDTKLNPVTQLLKDFQDQIKKYESERTQTQATFAEQFKNLNDINSQLSKETRALKDALKKPNVRGAWGETQLKNCLELAGMSQFADYSLQTTVTGAEDNNLRPDLVVHMPQGRRVIVDAKAPMEAFLLSLEASSDEERQIQLKRHAGHIREHIKKLSSKSYQTFVTESADFTVMFLPNESFLYAAIESDRTLVDDALNQKILIATPPTFVGLLKVIRYGWNEQKMTDNAKAVGDLASELHKRLCDFVETFDKIGDTLHKATEAYDRGRNSLNSRIISQARKLEEHGVKVKKELPEGWGQALDPTPLATATLPEPTPLR